MWCIDFGGHRVVGAARAEHLAGRGTDAVGIATLNHEVADDAVKQRAVEIALTGEFHKIVAMQRSGIVQADRNVAFRSVENCFHWVS